MENDIKATNPQDKLVQLDKIKQVIICRRDLNMRKGKIASQSCHASLSCILQLLTKISNIVDGDVQDITYSMNLKANDPVHQWLSHKFTKITVYVNSEEALLSVYKEAKNKSLLCSLIQDAGDTEFHGVPTYTAVAIGPDYSSKIDPITGQLPLL